MFFCFFFFILFTSDGDSWKKGEILTVSHLAHGRTQFQDPDQWNPNRQGLEAGFCFGAGVHACPGKVIAMSATTAIVQTLLPKIEKVLRATSLRFDRPSLADRQGCDVLLKQIKT